MIDMLQYKPEHRAELERLLSSKQWKAAIDSGLVDDVKANRIEPGNPRGFIDTVVDELLKFNKEKVRGLIADGYEDNTLLEELSKWPSNLAGEAPKISFLGLNLTAECNLKPRCFYCNQPYIESLVDLEGWKRVIEEVTSNNSDNSGGGPYIYITGGEPLLVGKDIWGDNGLVRFATQRGASVNINTNATIMTPEIALHIVKAGLAKLHISLDTSDRELQNSLRGNSFDKILEGIYNIQLARDLIGVSYPAVHTNCVLTNKNLDTFPQLFEFILEKKKQTASMEDPFFNDLFPHVIPIGGKSNDNIRPSEEEFKRFYEHVWPEVCSIWNNYQEGLEIPEDKRGVLFGYFSNPFLRVEHEGGIESYIKTSAEGRYGELALSRHCYVAPTQAAIAPDGKQYRCGSHAIRRILPIGDIKEGGVFDSIRRSISSLAELPKKEYCFGCALATLYINQAVEAKLKETLATMLNPEKP